MLPELSVLPRLWFRFQMLVYTQAKLQRYQLANNTHSPILLLSLVVLLSLSVVKSWSLYIVLVCWVTLL